MKLFVYKGFEKEFLENVQEQALVEGDIQTKQNVLLFDKKTRKKLDMSLLSLEDDESAWVTYEEYSVIKNRVDDAITEDGLELVIYINNLYPDYYPLPFDLPADKAQEIEESLNTDRFEEVSEETTRFLAIYNSLVQVDGEYYGSFYNYEYDNDDALLHNLGDLVTR